MDIRLTYFNIPFWRAEASRIALHMAGISFEESWPGREEFGEMRASGELPYGQLPVLDVDGVRIAQSLAIARFCGKLSGLYPKEDAIAAARVDELLDTASQMTELLAPSMRERDPQKKAELRAHLGAVTLPKWLGFLESRLAVNAPESAFVGSALTMADLVIWRLVSWLTGGILDGIPHDLLESCPGLTAHQEWVNNHPGVRSWADVRSRRKTT